MTLKQCEHACSLLHGVAVSVVCAVCSPPHASIPEDFETESQACTWLCGCLVGCGSSWLLGGRVRGTLCASGCAAELQNPHKSPPDLPALGLAASQGRLPGWMCGCKACWCDLVSGWICMAGSCQPCRACGLRGLLVWPRSRLGLAASQGQQGKAEFVCQPCRACGCEACWFGLALGWVWLPAKDSKGSSTLSARGVVPGACVWPAEALPRVNGCLAAGRGDIASHRPCAACVRPQPGLLLLAAVKDFPVQTGQAAPLEACWRVEALLVLWS